MEVQNGNDLLPRDLADANSAVRQSLARDSVTAIEYYDWMGDATLKALPHHDVLSSFRGESLDRVLARELFKPTRAVTEAVDQLLNQAPKGTVFIGIHARGVVKGSPIQGVEQKMFAFSASNPNAFANCALHMAAKHGDPVLIKYIVVSANEETRAAIVSLLPEGSVMSSRTTSAGSTHTLYAGTADRQRAAFDVTVDTFLLSRCRSLVLTESSSVSHFASYVAPLDATIALLPSSLGYCSS
jgi:hypothetical protein